MFVISKRYIVATKARPIEFHRGSGEMTKDFEDALLYDSKEDANYEIKTMDGPELFEVIEANLSCDI